MMPLLQLGQLGKRNAQGLLVRAASATVYVTSGTGTSETIPSSADVGDCLLAVLMHRSIITSVPSGWTLEVSVNAVSSVTHYVSVYRKICTAGEPGTSVAFTQTAAGRLALHILVCLEGNGLPLTVKASSSATGITATSMPLASVTSSGSSLFIGIVSFTNATTTPANSNISTPYTQTTPTSVDQNRLGVCHSLFSLGSVVSGNITTDAGPQTGTVAISLLLGY
jgi:hypothetical protein